MDTFEQVSSLLLKHYAIMLAVITVIAYLCVLAVQKGYNNYFNIPPEFVSLSPTTVFSYSLPLTIVFTLWLGLLVSIVPIIIGVIIFVVPFLPDSFNTSWQSLMRVYAGETKWSTLIWLIVKPWLIIWASVVTITVLVILSNYLGKSLAKKKTNFHVIRYPDLPGELVVILPYSDYLITAPLIRDSTGNQVEKKLHILKLSEMSNTPLTLENVGPLKVKQTVLTVLDS